MNTNYCEREYEKLKQENDELVAKYHHLTGEYNKVLIELAKAKDTIKELSAIDAQIEELKKRRDALAAGACYIPLPTYQSMGYDWTPIQGSYRDSEGGEE